MSCLKLHVGVTCSVELGAKIRIKESQIFGEACIPHVMLVAWLLKWQGFYKITHQESCLEKSNSWKAQSSLSCVLRHHWIKAILGIRLQSKLQFNIFVLYFLALLGSKIFQNKKENKSQVKMLYRSWLLVQLPNFRNSY